MGTSFLHANQINPWNNFSTLAQPSLSKVSWKFSEVCKSLKVINGASASWMLNHMQFASSVPGRFGFYAMFWGYFDLIKVPFKVMPCLWPSGSWQIRSRSFKWGTIHWFWSRGCKNIRRQSWRSKKILDLLGSRLRFSLDYIVNRCSPSDPGSIPG